MAKTALAVSEALYLRPLLHGLSQPSSPFSLIVDFPARNTLKLAERTENIKGAFLSPLDYARHGGEFRVVPDVCVSSEQRTDTIQLFVNSEVSNILKLAVDIRVTTEIILAKIILSEKFPNISFKDERFQIVPMLPDVPAMLNKADAALVVNLHPSERKDGKFVLDLVEEWNDMTELPYVHGFWVAREDDLMPADVKQLVGAGRQGVNRIPQIAREASREANASQEEYLSALSAFSYDFGTKESESVLEFYRQCYFHGVIGDIPDLNFFEL